MLTDVLPLLLFFLFYKLKGIYAATGVAIVSGILGTAYRYRTHGKVEPLPLFTLVLIIVLGGLTIYLKDPRFLIWKPTVAYLATALFFGFTCRSGQVPMFRQVCEKAGAEMRLSDAQWRNATLAYVGFFLFAGILNLVVASLVSLDTWVKFKVFGTMALSFTFMLSHGAWLSKRQLPPVLHELSQVTPEEP